MRWKHDVDLSFLYPLEPLEPMNEVLRNSQGLVHLLGPKPHDVSEELHPEERSHSLGFQTLPVQRRKKHNPNEDP